MTVNRWRPRRASIAEATHVAQLLHDFNTEFDAPTPGLGVLDLRLRRLFAGDATYCILAGDPPLGVALVDEGDYDTRRFYERHGFSA